MVSKDEAARLWKDHQRRLKERQREWREEQKKAGRRQLTCYLESEAFDLLRAVRAETGMKNSEIIAEALKRGFGDDDDDKQATNRNQAERVASKVAIDDEYKRRTLDKIRELSDGGKTQREIAEALNADGNPSFSGRNWTAKAVKATVRRYLKGD